MADAFDVHSSANVVHGLKDALKAMSGEIGIEVQSVSRSYEPEAQEEAQNRDGEVFAVAIQKRARWAQSYDISGTVIDEATFLALDEIDIGGKSFKVLNAKCEDKARGFLEGTATLKSWQNIP